MQNVVKTKSRKQRVVKTVDSSRDSDEIERLVAERRKYIAEMQESLLPGLDDDENAVDAFVGCLTNSQVKVVGLDLVFCRLYDHIGLNAIPSDMFRHMVMCRLVQLWQ